MRFPAFTGTEPCTQFDPDMFFPDSVQAGEREYREIRAICSGCPVQADCLEWGVQHELYGVWGGANARELSRLRSLRGILRKDPAWTLYVSMEKRSA